MFYPSDIQMYPDRYLTYVGVDEISDVLCGKFRPGHFKGVATVVAKLLNIVSPDVMYLGQKDAKQAVILKKIVVDLNFPVKVKVLPIIREPSGLAMSSRNSYLLPKQKDDAAVLFNALIHAKNIIKEGQRDTFAIKRTMVSIIRRRKSVTKIDYVSFLDPETLSTITIINGKVLIVLAVWFGKTRLIDNLIVNTR